VTNVTTAQRFYLFVFGGERPAGTFNQAEAYDTKTDAWSSHAAMPTARHGLGAAAVAGSYVVSGGPTPGDSVSAARSWLLFPWPTAAAAKSQSILEIWRDELRHLSTTP
jgi:Galactose oxidase, central domain